MPKITNRLNQRIALLLDSGKQLVLPPMGTESITPQDEKSPQVQAALEARKIMIVPDAPSSK